MFSSIVAAIGALLKLFGIGAEAAKENKDQQIGAALQSGADAEAELAIASQAAQARDAVRPVVRQPDGSWRLPDGETDPDCRDEPGVLGR